MQIIPPSARLNNKKRLNGSRTIPMNRFLPIFFLTFFTLFVMRLSGQSLSFNTSFGDSTLILDQYYFSNSKNDSVKIETLKFYVSDLTLVQNGKAVYHFPKKYFLIDFEKPSTLNIDLPKKKEFDAIQFHLGIDSTTNVSGAMGGDLDPVYGMYWSWQSGYINFKIEGVSNVCATRNHVFQFHLGGYLSPFASIQTVELLLNDKRTITLDLFSFLNSISLSETNEVMSPNEKAVELSKLIAKNFKTGK